MTRPWEFYEKLNEIVYAADMDTYEMEYMNAKGLEMYGYTNVEQIKGKKCYEVLQSQDKPCDFCTNKCLVPGEFYEWKHYNEILKRTYSSKDTIAQVDGKHFRVELSFDMTVEEEQKKTIIDFRNNEQMVNEGLRIALEKQEPTQSIQCLLQYIGEHLKSERVYIFEENRKGFLDNTFEWCAKGVVPQIDNLQNVPFEVVSLWYQAFEKNDNIIIKDLEDIRQADPLAYQYLLPQDIHSLVVNPIRDKDQVIGFYGVDNPPRESLNHVSTLFGIIGHFITSMLKRRDLVKRLENLSMNDQMTQVGNRHAMHKFQKMLQIGKSVAVLYFDVMGLKKINDIKGHKAGDELLIRACNCIKKHFYDQSVFRLGGDEFIVISENLDEQSMHARVSLLKEDMVKEEARMAIGCVFEMSYQGDFDTLLAKADGEMYEDKRNYYKKSERV